MLSNKTKSLIFAVLPLIIAVLIMIPRLTSAQFGLLDDGYILNEVRTILRGDLSMRLDLEAGRFRPIYWLYFTLIYALAGPNPLWFFFGHLIILLVLLMIIRSLMKQYGANEGQILLTSFVFLFSIPIIENFYTLSKSETLQLVFILLALLCFEKLKNSLQTQTTLIFAVLMFINILAAIWAKETTYILIPLAVLWTAYVLYNRKYFPSKAQWAHLIFLGAILLATGVNFLISSNWGAVLVTDGTYTSQYNLSLMTILSRAPRWMTLYAFYFHYLLPLAIMAVIIICRKENHHSRIQHDLFFWGGWILAWSVGFFPWEYAEVYYLLPFSLGVSIITGLLIPHILRELTTSKPSLRRSLSLMVFFFASLFIVSLSHFRTHALTQLTFDRMNHQMMAKTKDLLENDGDLIMGVNTYNEYVQNLGHFLIDQEGMNKITYDYVSLEILLGIESRTDAILLLPFIQNQPRLLLRAGVEEEFTMAWVDEIEHTLEGNLQSLAYFRSGFQINNINLPVIICPVLGNRGFCTNPDPFFDTRLFSYGWDIYRIR